MTARWHEKKFRSLSHHHLPPLQTYPAMLCSIQMRKHRRRWQFPRCQWQKQTFQALLIPTRLPRCLDRSRWILCRWPPHCFLLLWQIPQWLGITHQSQWHPFLNWWRTRPRIQGRCYQPRHPHMRKTLLEVRHRRHPAPMRHPGAETDRRALSVCLKRSGVSRKYLFAPRLQPKLHRKVRASIRLPRQTCRPAPDIRHLQPQKQAER